MQTTPGVLKIPDAFEAVHIGLGQSGGSGFGVQSGGVVNALGEGEVGLAVGGVVEAGLEPLRIVVHVPRGPEMILSVVAKRPDRPRRAVGLGGGSAAGL